MKGKKFWVFLLVLISAAFVGYYGYQMGWYNNIKTEADIILTLCIPCGLGVAVIFLFFSIFSTGYKPVAGIGILANLVGIFFKFDDVVKGFENVLGVSHNIALAFAGFLILVELAFIATLLGMLRGTHFNTMLFIGSLIVFIGFVVLFLLQNKNMLIDAIKNHYYYIVLVYSAIAYTIGGMVYKNE